MSLLATDSHWPPLTFRDTIVNSIELQCGFHRNSMEINRNHSILSVSHWNSQCQSSFDASSMSSTYRYWYLDTGMHYWCWNLNLETAANVVRRKLPHGGVTSRVKHQALGKPSFPCRVLARRAFFLLLLCCINLDGNNTLGIPCISAIGAASRSHPTSRWLSPYSHTTWHPLAEGVITGSKCDTQVTFGINDGVSNIFEYFKNVRSSSKCLRLGPRTLSPSGPELGLSLVNLTRYMHCLSSLG